jgi:hypothetical protein
MRFYLNVKHTKVAAGEVWGLWSQQSFLMLTDRPVLAGEGLIRRFSAGRLVMVSGLSSVLPYKLNVSARSN